MASARPVGVVTEGMAVMSRRGSNMGAVQDFVVDVAGDTVTGLILHGNRLLVLDEDVQTGPDVIIAKSPELLVALPDDPQQKSWWKRIRDALSRHESDEDALLLEATGEE